MLIIRFETIEEFSVFNDLIFQVILPLRALLLKKLDIKKYKALLALQSHRKEREEMGKTEVGTEIE